MDAKIPDTFQALLTYPKGFLVSYATSFGNDAPGYTRIMGKKATLFNTGGEGSPRWALVEEKGNHEQNELIDAATQADGCVVTRRHGIAADRYCRRGSVAHDELV